MGKGMLLYFVTYSLFKNFCLLTCNLYRFLPSRLAASGIGDLISRYYTDPWPSWKKISAKTRDSMFEEFLVRFPMLMTTKKFAYVCLVYR